MTLLTQKILHNKIDSVCRTIAVYEQAKAMLAAKGEQLGEIQEMRLAGLYEDVKFDLRRLFKNEIGK